MARKLLTVEDSFEIRHRGLILVPGIVPEGDERFKIGEPIILKKPDGSSIETKIGGLEIFTTPPRHLDDFGIMIMGMAKGDIPIGTEVWSVDV